MRTIKIKNDSGSNTTISGSTLADQEILELNTYQDLEKFRNSSSYIQLVGSQELIVQDSEGDIADVSTAMAWLFEDNPSDVKIIEEIAPPPFAAKVLSDGSKLFKRVHGVRKTLSGDTTYSFDVPYDACKITALEIVWAPVGIQADLKVYDTPTGLIQQSMGIPAGSITPSLLLNQFGFESGIAKDYYEEVSQYDADLIKDMKLEVTLINPNSETDEVCVNFILHELK